LLKNAPASALCRSIHAIARHYFIARIYSPKFFKEDISFFEELLSKGNACRLASVRERWNGPTHPCLKLKNFNLLEVPPDFEWAYDHMELPVLRNIVGYTDGILSTSQTQLLLSNYMRRY
ncbi:MAG: hypothetical protein WCG27_13490, partial [Pseudomonadota bacterium]